MQRDCLSIQQSTDQRNNYVKGLETRTTGYDTRLGIAPVPTSPRLKTTVSKWRKHWMGLMAD